MLLDYSKSSLIYWNPQLCHHPYSQLMTLLPTSLRSDLPQILTAYLLPSHLLVDQLVMFLFKDMPSTWVPGPMSSTCSRTSLLNSPFSSMSSIFSLYCIIPISILMCKSSHLGKEKEKEGWLYLPHQLIPNSFAPLGSKSLWKSYLYFLSLIPLFLLSLKPTPVNSVWDTEAVLNSTPRGRAMGWKNVSSGAGLAEFESPLCHSSIVWI